MIIIILILKLSKSRTDVLHTGAAPPSTPSMIGRRAGAGGVLFVDLRKKNEHHAGGWGGRTRREGRLVRKRSRKRSRTKSFEVKKVKKYSKFKAG